MQNTLSPLDDLSAESNDVLFSLEIDLESDVISVVMAGELDISTGRRLVSAMEPFSDCGRRVVRIDLGRISFIDSSGALAIMELSDWAAAHDGSLEVAACSHPVERIFSMLEIPVPGVLQDS